MVAKSAKIAKSGHIAPYTYLSFSTLLLTSCFCFLNFHHFCLSSFIFLSKSILLYLFFCIKSLLTPFFLSPYCLLLWMSFCLRMPNFVFVCFIYVCLLGTLSYLMIFLLSSHFVHVSQPNKSNSYIISLSLSYCSFFNLLDPDCT